MPALPASFSASDSAAVAATSSMAARPTSRPPAVLQRMLSLHDFEAEARRRLPRPIFGYIAGAAEDNTAHDDNRAVFGEYRLLPRVLRDVSAIDASVQLFGQRFATPFGIAPMGITGLSTYRGDLALAAAAQQAGIAAVMSATSLMPMEALAAQCPSTWFQAYLPGDPERIDALVDRVARAGFGTLVVTVDLAVHANRENNVRTGFSTPLRPGLRLAWDGLTRPRWLLHTFARTLLRHGMPHFENSFAIRGAPIVSRNVLRDFSARAHLSWQHLAAIRARWQGHLVVKGILHPEDAVLAQELGCDGVILSNHGGRQLDGAVSALRVLQATVAAVGPDYPVMVDGGFRRGTDVLKALALGARMVWLGRPFNYAAAVAGQAGVEHAIALLRAEVERDMAMLGVTRCRDLGAAQLLNLGERWAVQPDQG